MASVFFLTAYDDFALGIRSLAALLDEHGHKTQLCFFKGYKTEDAPYLLKNPHNYQYIRSAGYASTGYDANPWTREEEDLLCSLVRHENPSIIALSTRNYIDEELCGLLRRLKKVCPDALYVAGGFGPTFTPEVYLKEVDFVGRGEGEGVMLDIAAAVDSGANESIKSLANISYLKDGKVVNNPLRPLLLDLDALPFPKISDTDCCFIDDGTVVWREKDSAYNLLVGRGCMNRCTYCCAGEWRRLYRDGGHTVKPYRPKSLDRVKLEVRRAAEKGYGTMFIADSFLLMDVEEQKELFREIKKYGMRFMLHFHPDLALKHPDLVAVAYESGLTTTVVGIQHGSESFAGEIYNRPNNNETILRFARLLSKFEDLTVRYHMITGNPLETDKHFEEQLELIRRLKEDDEIQITHIVFHRLKLFPNTTLHNQIVVEKGLEQSIEDMIYKSQMSVLRLWLDDDAFERVYQDPYYREKPYFLLHRVYEQKIEMEKRRIRSEVEHATRKRMTFETSRRRVLDLESILGRQDLSVSHHVARADINERGHLVIEAFGNDPWVLLRSIPLEPEKRYMCRATVETDVKDATLQLFYINSGTKEVEFNEANSHKLALTRGIQDYYVELKDVGPHLRFDMGDKPGKYVIPSFEIREI